MASKSALTDSIGSIDAATIAKDYPHLATKLALNTAKAAGLDTKNPQNLVTAMNSNVYQRSLKEEMQGRRDSRALSRVMQPAAAPTFDSNASFADAGTRGYQSMADSIRRTGQGRSILFGQMMQENERLAELAGFNETAYKKKRLSEMRPTDDIDKEIMGLRNRALFSKASMYDELGRRGIPYGAQTRAVAAMQKVFIDQVNDLQELRTARIKDAENRIQEEMDAHTGRVESSKTRISGLSKAIEILKEQGADDASLAQLMIDHSKEMDRLRKERAKGASTGMTDSIDVITQALTKKYMEDHAGEEPSNDAQQEIKRQAEFIVKNRGDLTGKILESGGDFQRLRTGDQTVEETVPRNWFLRMLPDSLVSPTTTRSRTVPGSDIIEEAGFGIPYSAADEAELRRKRDLAGIE